MTDEQQFNFQPIGILRSPYANRIDAPHQSTVTEGTASGAEAPATLELADWVDERALKDLEDFERIWLIYVLIVTMAGAVQLNRHEADQNVACWRPAHHIVPTPLVCQQSRWKRSKERCCICSESICLITHRFSISNPMSHTQTLSPIPLLAGLMPWI